MIVESIIHAICKWINENLHDLIMQKPNKNVHYKLYYKK